MAYDDPVQLPSATTPAITISRQLESTETIPIVILMREFIVYAMINLIYFI